VISRVHRISVFIDFFIHRMSVVTEIIQLITPRAHVDSQSLSKGLFTFQTCIIHGGGGRNYKPQRNILDQNLKRGQENAALQLVESLWKYLREMTLISYTFGMVHTCCAWKYLREMILTLYNFRMVHTCCARHPIVLHAFCSTRLICLPSGIWLAPLLQVDFAMFHGGTLRRASNPYFGLIQIDYR